MFLYTQHLSFSLFLSFLPPPPPFSHFSFASCCLQLMPIRMLELILYEFSSEGEVIHSEEIMIVKQFRPVLDVFKLVSLNCNPKSIFPYLGDCCFSFGDFKGHHSEQTHTKKFNIYSWINLDPKLQTQEYKMVELTTKFLQPH